MDDETITALAAGVAPFVRECVADAIASLPPELAEQVASAARLLREPPPVIPPQPVLRIARVERDRDGNFVPIYEA